MPPSPELAAHPYVVASDEIAPDAKQLAADVLQAIGTYDIGEGTVASARQRLTDLGVAPGVVEAAAGLLDPAAASALEIVYPQMSGLGDTDAGLMVVTRQILEDGNGRRSITRTIDLRLSRVDGAWVATEIASLGGEPVTSAPPTDVARRVLEHPGIDLPDSAAWDIRAGRIFEPLLERLLDLAANHTLAVTVLASGHPAHVYASSSVSNHTKGRGVDIWAVDGVPVIEQRGQDSPLMQVVRDQIAAGVTEIGAPWDLDGPGGPVFTDILHQDHLHLAYDE